MWGSKAKSVGSSGGVSEKLPHKDTAITTALWCFSTGAIYCLLYLYVSPMGVSMAVCMARDLCRSLSVFSVRCVVFEIALWIFS